MSNRNDRSDRASAYRGREEGAVFFGRFKIEPALPVLLSFALLQIFKLLSLLVTNKTVENILIIPLQLLVFLFPFFFYLKYRYKGSLAEQTKGLRLRLPHLYQLPLILSALLLLVCGNVLISLVFSGTGKLEEGFTLYNTFVSRNSGGFFTALYLIIAYAAVPAFCEEITFRAILCREYERHNVVCGIAVSSLFFAMLHFDIYLLPVYLFSGVLLALTMYATGSVIASMAVHMAFNIFGLFGQPYLNAFYSITGGTDGLFIFILCMMTILSAALFCGFASRCYAVRSRRSSMPDRKLLPPPNKTTHILAGMILTPFAIAAICLYIAVTVIGIFL